MTPNPRDPLRFEAPVGEIIGWRDHGVIRATGIRYARAARFERPTPEPRASAPVEATTWSPACPQLQVPFLERVLGSTLAHLGESEDCLRLSVTRPLERGVGETLPVMVWIHGGSYVSGAGDALAFDVRALVEAQRVVVVAVTYRLGLLGFLGGTGGRPANLGLFDMLEALRWVKTNIATFGGDPANVTLFGQSAGGDAIAHLMISEGAEGLFRRVIIQSAPLGISLGRKKMSEAMASIASRISASAPVEEVVAKQNEVAKVARRFGLIGAMPFGTQYGQAPLPDEDELDEAWSRVASRYEVLIGFAAEEGTLFLPGIPAIQRATQLPLVGGLARLALVSLINTWVYRKANARFAERHAGAGGVAYTYLITWGSKTNGFGATHTIDLPLLFGDEQTWRTAQLVEGAPWEEVHRHAQQVRALWAQFASAGQLPDAGAIEPDVLTYRRSRSIS